TRQLVAQRLAAIRQESSDTTAGRARAQLSAFYVRMVQEGIAEQNVVLGTKGQAERPERDRVLDNDELKALWNACGDDDYGRIIKLLMLTGCRKTEIGDLKWSEIDIGKATITLPAERTKNGREHVVPLSALALDIINSIHRRVDRDPVFGERAD